MYLKPDISQQVISSRLNQETHLLPPISCPLQVRKPSNKLLLLSKRAYSFQKKRIRRIVPQSTDTQSLARDTL